MRRSLAAVAGTAVGLIALLGYKSGSAPKQVAVGAGPGAGGAPGGAAPAAPSTTAPPTTAAPSVRTPSPATPSPTTSPPTSPTTSPTTPPRSSTGMSDGTFTGPVVSTRYGPVQVRVTISDGQLADVSAVELPVDRARSAAISNAVAPILRREALAAKGATIDTVSGATYTSQGYARSLQAALDAARS